jgi:predicted GNAT family N-acyltransferase
MIKVITFDINDTEKLQYALSIRREVFVKEQGVEKSLEQDNNEDTAQHYLAYYHDFAVGTARWRITENGIKFERFAVLHDYRNKKIGQALLDSALFDAKTKGKTIYLHAQKSAVNFYLRNGFSPVGEPFLEAGIEHINMQWFENLF